jgi:DnaJ-class molecular chaperone
MSPTNNANVSTSADINHTIARIRSKEAIFHDIQGAWETLRDPEKRAHYDTELEGNLLFLPLK